MPNIFFVSKSKGIQFRGFTLVEIMVTVAIIGIIIAVAVPSWTNSQKRSKEKSCLENLRQIENGKHQWAIEFSMEDTATPAMEDLVPQFVKTAPVCPSGGNYTLSTVNSETNCSVHGTASSITP